MSAGITLCKARCPKYDAFTCILQIGSVDLMLEGIERGAGRPGEPGLAGARLSERWVKALG
ncbi:MAG: hypothetical protein OSB38_41595, partial [Paraburkholderia fungorum]|nr:hypothetical protein [Paraburkholderia fungorum]